MRAAIACMVVIGLGACTASPPPGSYHPNFARPDVQNTAKTLSTLARHMDHTQEPSRLRMGMIHSSDVNAASAGNQAFYFTDGFTQSNDDVLIRGVIAHELAHDDKEHVAQGMAVSILVSTVFTIANAYAPGVGYADQIVNPLVTRAFSRTQELEADRHAVTILERSFIADGMNPDEAKREALATMDHTLRFLRERYGHVGGGMLATHPAVDDRIAQIGEIAIASSPPQTQSASLFLSLPAASTRFGAAFLPDLTRGDLDGAASADGLPLFVFIYSRDARYSQRAAPFVQDLAARHAGRARFTRLEAHKSSEVMGTAHPLHSPMFLVLLRGREVARVPLNEVDQGAGNEKLTMSLNTLLDNLETRAKDQE